MPASQPRSRLLLDPTPESWAGLVRGARSDDIARETRAALGVDAGRPVVMAGHQPGFWHAGILAKWFAAGALAERVGGSAAWVVVDQSPGAGAVLEYPALRAGRLTRGRLDLGDASLPPGAQPPARFEPPGDAALAGVRGGLELAARLLGVHAGAGSLARQLQSACAEALGPDGAAATFFASDLHKTRAFIEIVGAMRADPERCQRLYNEAAVAQPHAGVRELKSGDGVVELPLWERPEPRGPWRTVMSDRLADLPDERLVLRGLPMTGLLRRWVCDLFIHGTGGGASHTGVGYDRVTERWMRSWLGAEDLAPAVVASATVCLDFGPLAEDIPTPGDIAAARDLAHRAEHDPALLGEAELGRRKRELARRIDGLPRHSPERAALYGEMQRLRAGAAGDHPGELRALRTRAETLATRSREADIVADRTWPWVFYPSEQIRGLRDGVGRALGVQG